MKSARNETGSPTAGIETVRLMPAIGASLLSLLTTYGPVVLFLIVLVEEAGVPLLLPSDLMLLVVGSRVAQCGRPRSVRGAYRDRLVSARHAQHASPRVLGRHAGRD